MIRNTVRLVLLIIIVFLFGCDIYDKENKDWPNEVTLTIINHTACPLNFRIDGEDKGEFEPGESFDNNDYGKGIHLLEAYPWNNSRYYCDSEYTPELKNGDIFEWEITSASACNQCDPTPTPPAEPTATPGPEATATPSP